jgi:hypothetical protein
MKEFCFSEKLFKRHLCVLVSDKPYLNGRFTLNLECRNSGGNSNNCFSISPEELKELGEWLVEQSRA